MPILDFATAIRQVKAGEIHPLYHCKGSDIFLQDFLVNEVVRVLQEKGKCEKKVLSVSDVGGGEVIAWITTTDLFTQYKVALLRDPQQLRGKERKEFLDYITRPIRSHVVFTFDAGDQKRTAMLKALEGAAVTVDVSTPDEVNLRKWVHYLAQERGLVLAGEVKDWLVARSGDSLPHIQNDLDKLALNFPPGKTITLQDLQNLSGWRRSFELDDFLRAVGRRNAHQALEVGMKLIQQADSILFLVFPLSTLFSELLYRHLDRQGTFQSQRGFIPLSFSIRKELPEYGKKYTVEEVLKAVQHLHEIDKRNKQTQYPALTELSQFVARVVASRA
ncbi:MAG: DNA polymerase III subunit delta [Candidatus Neomarinimicrobiota bacterium]|nr:MAG: DNA polymerase III subunit delta [Candidatus Neomarinimicrobiota bacterium]